MTEGKKVSDLAKLARIKPGQRLTFELEAISKDQKCHAVVAIDYVDIHTKQSISGLFKVKSLDISPANMNAEPINEAQLPPASSGSTSCHEE